MKAENLESVNLMIRSELLVILFIYLVPDVVETAARVSAPVLVAPLRRVLVTEGHSAQFQCTVSGEGNDNSSPFWILFY